MITKIGLIEGRHPMPVDKYLLLQDVAEKEGFHGKLFATAYIAAKELVSELSLTEVILFTTGLTNAAMGAFLGFRETGVFVYIASFDSVSKEYIVFPANESAKDKQNIL